MVNIDTLNKGQKSARFAQAIAGLRLAIVAAAIILLSASAKAQTHSSDSVVVFLSPANFSALPGSRQWYTVELDSVKDLGAFQFDLMVKDTTAKVDSLQLGAFFRNMPGRSVVMLPPDKKTRGDTCRIAFADFSFGPTAGATGHGAIARFRIFFPGAKIYTLQLEKVQLANSAGVLIPIKAVKNSRAIISTNPPPVINVALLRAQLRFAEDDSLQIALLNAAADPNDSPNSLVWQAASGPNLRAVVKPSTQVLTLASRRQNWNGQDTLRLTVADPRGAKDTAKFTVTILPVNDPPSTPQLLAPAHRQTSTLLKWSKAIDPDIGDTVRYLVQIAADSSFTPVIVAKELAAEELAIREVSGALAVGRIYNWRVKAMDQQNVGSGFSARQSFRYQGGDIVTVVENAALTKLPRDFALEQNYPNPISLSREVMTVIRIDLPRAGQVSLQVFNLLGQSVRNLLDAEMSPGYHRMIWDGKDDRGNRVPAGVYFYQLDAGKVNLTRKLVVIR